VRITAYPFFCQAPAILAREASISYLTFDRHYGGLTAMSRLLEIILLPLLAYLLGSIPFGLIIVRVVRKTDIRRIGSGNIGATNVRRTAGTRWAAAALACDVLKGLLPTLAAAHVNPSTSQWLPALTALAAVCGHMYPLYLKFRPSGKGVATTLGAWLVAAPWACLGALLTFLVVVRLCRRVSVGSLSGALLLPPATWFTGHDPILTLTALIIMILILMRHEENLSRLANKREPVLGKS
jgi:glycerol-3-phosphate acyltransferase PlsY